MSAVQGMGQGIATSLAQLAVDVFQLPIERIRVVFGDTDAVNVTLTADGGYALSQPERGDTIDEHDADVGGAENGGGAVDLGHEPESRERAAASESPDASGEAGGPDPGLEAPPQIQLADADVSFLKDIGAFCKAEKMTGPEGDTRALETLLAPRGAHVRKTVDVPALYTAVAEILAFVYRLRNPRYGREAGARAAS